MKALGITEAYKAKNGLTAIWRELHICDETGMNIVQNCKADVTEDGEIDLETIEVKELARAQAGGESRYIQNQHMGTAFRKGCRRNQAKSIGVVAQRFEGKLERGTPKAPVKWAA